MFVRKLFQSIVELPGKFAQVAMHDPISGVLLAIGAIITLLTVGYLALLTLGVLANFLSPSPGGQPRQPGR